MLHNVYWGIFPINQIVARVQKGVKCPLTECVSNATISSSTLQHHLFFCKVRHLSFRLTDVRPTKLYLLRIFDQFPSPYSFTPSSNHFVSSTFHFFLGGTVGSFTLRHLRLVGLDSSAKEIVWCWNTKCFFISQCYFIKTGMKLTLLWNQFACIAANRKSEGKNHIDSLIALCITSVSSSDCHSISSASLCCSLYRLLVDLVSRGLLPFLSTFFPLGVEN